MYGGTALSSCVTDAQVSLSRAKWWPCASFNAAISSKNNLASLARKIFYKTSQLQHGRRYRAWRVDNGRSRARYKASASERLKHYYVQWLLSMSRYRLKKIVFCRQTTTAYALQSIVVIDIIAIIHYRVASIPDNSRRCNDYHFKLVIPALAWPPTFL